MYVKVPCKVCNISVLWQREFRGSTVEYLIYMNNISARSENKGKSTDQKDV